MLTFYILAAALTIIACLAILLPFIRDEAGGKRDARDIDVYREQLAEIEADAARGLIGEAQAAEARAELGRRILKAAGDERGRRAPPTAGRWAIVAAVMALPLLSMSMYWLAGAPGLADQPLAARLQGNPAESSIAELVARTERHLAANPEDGTGWSVIAPVYQRLGRHGDAIAAWRRAIDLLGEDASLLAGLGESLAAADGGRVGPEARQWFVRALALAPEHEKSRFFLALANVQDGRLDAAAEGWKSLVDEAPVDSQWAALARQALGELARMRAEGGAGGERGPGADDMEAVAALPEAERTAMIEGMVASLAARLEQEPHDPEGWERLIRSYIVLERRQDAATALAGARTALAQDAAAMARMENLARELNLAGG